MSFPSNARVLALRVIDFSTTRLRRFGQNDGGERAEKRGKNA